MKFWQIWSHEIEYETEKTLLISSSNKLPKRRKRESARRGVEEEDVTFKSCAKGDSEVTELLRRPEMGCDGAAAEIGDGLWLDRDRRWIGEEKKFWSEILKLEIFLFNLDVGVKWVQFSISSVLVISKTVQLITDPLSMDWFETVIYRFSLILVRFSSVQQFGSNFGFFAHPYAKGKPYKSIYKLKVQNTKKAPPKTKTKLQMDTHTKKWVFSPIIIAVIKSRLFWFQP